MNQVLKKKKKKEEALFMISLKYITLQMNKVPDFFEKFGHK